MLTLKVSMLDQPPDKTSEKSFRELTLFSGTVQSESSKFLNSVTGVKQS